jgi:hypothetical protein
MVILGSDYFMEHLNFYWINFITMIIKLTVATRSVTITRFINITVTIITTIIVVIAANFIIKYTKN